MNLPKPHITYTICVYVNKQRPALLCMSPPSFCISPLSAFLLFVCSEDIYEWPDPLHWKGEKRATASDVSERVTDLFISIAKLPYNSQTQLLSHSQRIFQCCSLQDWFGKMLICTGKNINIFYIYNFVKVLLLLCYAVSAINNCKYPQCK